MKKCPYCGTEVNDDSLFCTECGKEFPKGLVCPHCGASMNEGDTFCTNCGKNINEVSAEQSGNRETPDVSDNSTSKKIIPVILGVILVAILGAGWWLLSSKESDEPLETTSEPLETTSEPLETTLVSFKKTAHGEVFDVEAEINVDFPQKGNANLIKNITSLLIDALTDEYRNYKDANPHYNGDISDGQAIIDFYGNEKIKELQNEGIGYAKISVLKTYETDKIVSYTIDFSGSNGGVGFGAKYGTSFNKADGTTIKVIETPNDSDFKNYLISKVKSHLDGEDESELEAHPYPNKAPYLTKDGVSFIYQQYEIGSGALGEVELTIPYNAMKPYMSEIALSLVEVGNDGQTAIAGAESFPDNSSEVERSSNSNNGMSESNKQKTLEYMSELQQIANEIDNVYNQYVRLVSSGNLDPMAHGNLEIRATQNISKLRSQAESIWNKLIALARETGGDVRALQEEKKKYLGDAYKMQLSLHSVGMNTNY